jgi:hypothetical protein
MGQRGGLADLARILGMQVALARDPGPADHGQRLRRMFDLRLLFDVIDRERDSWDASVAGKPR